MTTAAVLPLFGMYIPLWIRPLWLVAAGAATAAVALAAISILTSLIFPRTAAVARSTAKEAIAQPLFGLTMAIGVFALILFTFLPYNTFGEDIKMVKDTGLTLMTVLSILLASWTASVSINDELEGRTALTLLSKPLTRRQFIIGKFLGILFPVAVLLIVLGTVFFSTLSYKVAYDARETGQAEVTVEQCQKPIAEIAPAMALTFMETMIFTSISVAIATRLAMQANLALCFTIYVLGHLMPLLAGASIGQQEQVAFFANLLSAILPVLDHFNCYTAISSDQAISIRYIGWAGIYCLLYCLFALVVSLLLFEDRDLA